MTEQEIRQFLVDRGFDQTEAIRITQEQINRAKTRIDALQFVREPNEQSHIIYLATAYLAPHYLRRPRLYIPSKEDYENSLSPALADLPINVQTALWPFVDPDQLDTEAPDAESKKRHYEAYFIETGITSIISGNPDMPSLSKEEIEVVVLEIAERLTWQTNAQIDSKIAAQNGALRSLISSEIATEDAKIQKDIEDAIAVEDAIIRTFVRTTNDANVGSIQQNAANIQANASDIDTLEGKVATLEAGGNNPTSGITQTAGDARYVRKTLNDTEEAHKVVKRDAAGNVNEGLIAAANIANEAVDTKHLSGAIATLLGGAAQKAGATFTGAVKGITPTADADLATKKYVDDEIVSNAVDISGKADTSYVDSEISAAIANIDEDLDDNYYTRDEIAELFPHEANAKVDNTDTANVQWLYIEYEATDGNAGATAARISLSNRINGWTALPSALPIALPADGKFYQLALIVKADETQPSGFTFGGNDVSRTFYGAEDITLSTVAYKAYILQPALRRSSANNGDGPYVPKGGGARAFTDTVARAGVAENKTAIETNKTDIATVKATAEGADSKADTNTTAIATVKTTADAAMPRAGGVFTGAPSWATAPSADAHLANKKYVDEQITANAGSSGGNTSGGSAPSKRIIFESAAEISKAVSGTSKSIDFIPANTSVAEAVDLTEADDNKVLWIRAFYRTRNAWIIGSCPIDILRSAPPTGSSHRLQFAQESIFEQRNIDFATINLNITPQTDTATTKLHAIFALGPNSANTTMRVQNISVFVLG